MESSLTIELGTSLLLDFTYHRGRETHVEKNVPAALIGLDHGTHLAVKLTAGTHKQYQYVFSNIDKITARYIQNGNAYAFQVALLSKTESPVPILYFSYPREIECRGLRKNERCRSNPLSTIKTAGGSYLGLLNDVNMHGCRVDLLGDYSVQAGKLQKETRVDLSFQLPGNPDTLTGGGVVTWIRQVEEEWCMGINFTTLPETTNVAIGAFMEQAGATGK